MNSSMFSFGKLWSWRKALSFWVVVAMDSGLCQLRRLLLEGRAGIVVSADRALNLSPVYLLSLHPVLNFCSFQNSRQNQDKEIWKWGLKVVLSDSLLLTQDAQRHNMHLRFTRTGPQKPTILLSFRGTEIHRGNDKELPCHMECDPRKEAVNLSCKLWPTRSQDCHLSTLLAWPAAGRLWLELSIAPAEGSPWAQGRWAAEQRALVLIGCGWSGGRCSPSRWGSAFLHATWKGSCAMYSRALGEVGEMCASRDGEVGEQGQTPEPGDYLL